MLSTIFKVLLLLVFTYSNSHAKDVFLNQETFNPSHNSGSSIITSICNWSSRLLKGGTEIKEVTPQTPHILVQSETRFPDDPEKETLFRTYSTEIERECDRAKSSCPTETFAIEVSQRAGYTSDRFPKRRDLKDKCIDALNNYNELFAQGEPENTEFPAIWPKLEEAWHAYQTLLDQLVAFDLNVS